MSKDLLSQERPAAIPTNYGALSTLVTVFFFWGFIAAGNSVFIPFCKHFFNLDQFQSQLMFGQCSTMIAVAPPLSCLKVDPLLIQ